MTNHYKLSGYPEYDEDQQAYVLVHKTPKYTKRYPIEFTREFPELDTAQFHNHNIVFEGSIHGTYDRSLSRHRQVLFIDNLSIRDPLQYADAIVNELRLDFKLTKNPSIVWSKIPYLDYPSFIIAQVPVALRPSLSRDKTNITRGGLRTRLNRKYNTEEVYYFVESVRE